MATVEIAVPLASTSPAPKPYTQYTVSVRQPLRSFTLSKRYSEFVELHATLVSAAGETPAPLPAKSWFKSTVSSPELTEERRRGLEQYLQAINTGSDPRWRKTEAWRKFLNLPAAATRADSKRSDVGTGNVDPAVWLDIHRELKALLGDARKALRRRTEAMNPQAQHEAAAETKKLLVRAGTLVAALQAGLQRLSEQSKHKEDEARLGEGEILRRRDLVSAAVKERDALEAQLTASSQTGQTAPVEAPEPIARPGTIAPGRRVLGAAKETERTRELDNQGVLQLQKQIMAEQDEDVGALAAVAGRLREMGIQINAELTYQNQMLDIVDQDVERVGDKIGVAKKKIGKIS